MLVAGEPSGDRLAGELVQALRRQARTACREISFFGAGGEHLRASGAEVVLDLPRHAIIGIPSLPEYLRFRGFRNQLVRLACERRPEVVICVDFFAFNGSLAQLIRKQFSYSGSRPRMVQYVSPQVWASRAGRARILEETHDLLLSILPFEKEWYAIHAPRLHVEFVGHPIMDRPDRLLGLAGNADPKSSDSPRPRLVLLPGSRAGEIARHLPVVADAWRRIRDSRSVEGVVVAANELVASQLRAHPLSSGLPPVRIGGLGEALRGATVALACTGTVMLECAVAGIPTVAFYKTSWLTYNIARRIVTVKYLAMPNVMADREVYPEFVQERATGPNLAAAVNELMENADRRNSIRQDLQRIAGSLGTPGAADRAAAAIFSTMLPGSDS